MSFLNCDRVLMDPGVVENGEIKDKKKLGEYLDRLFEANYKNFWNGSDPDLTYDQKIKKYFNKAVSGFRSKEITLNKVNFALPDNQVYTHFFVIKYVDNDEIEKLVYREAISCIPLKKEKIWYKYKILKKEKSKEGKMMARIFLAAADKDVCKNWQEFLEEKKLEIKAFDLPYLVSYRGLKDNTKKGVAVADIGADRTALSIFKNGSPVYSCSINIAGNKFVEVISRAGGVSDREARKKKKSGGLNMKNKKIRQSLEEKVHKLAGEIKRTFEYIKGEYGTEVKKIILIGGGAKTKGIIELFEQETRLKTETGEVSLFKDKISLEYVCAFGLALGGLRSKHDRELRIPLVKKEKNIDPEEDLVEEDDDREDDGKTRDDLRRKVIILGIILAIGVVSVLGAYIFRKQEKGSLNTKPTGNIEEYSNNRVLNLDLPLAVSSEDHGRDRVRARMVEVAVEDTGNYNENKERALELVNYKKGPGESLWSQPVNIASSSAGSEEVVFDWLIYSEDDLSKVLAQKLKDEGFRDNFIFNSIEKKKVKETDDPDIYQMSTELSISTK